MPSPEFEGRIGKGMTSALGMKLPPAAGMVGFA